MFDVPSMLGEYLLPLIIVVPLAVVVLLIASRGAKDDARPPAPPPWTPPVRPPVAAAPKAAAPDIALDSRPPALPPRDFQPTSPFLDPLDQTLPDTRTVSPHAFAPTEPAALDTLPPPMPAPRPSPIAYAPTEPAPLDAPILTPAPAAAAGTPVLVVDDSAVVRAKLSKLLQAAGYAVTLARHGQDALEQIQQHWFAVMITDLEMPEMDGFELIAHVSNDLRTENLPIIAITGHEALQAKVQDAKGLFGIFKKPWNDRELLARVGVLAQLRPRG